MVFALGVVVEMTVVTTEPCAVVAVTVSVLVTVMIGVPGSVLLASEAVAKAVPSTAVSKAAQASFMVVVYLFTFWQHVKF